MDKAKILVVDDTPANLEVLSTILSQDYKVSIATNGHDAIRLATREPHPDLILLDIMMPDIDGYQVCRVLKKKPETRNIPIIFVTAINEIESEERGLQMGAVDYIMKPVTPSIVLARVRTHLALYNETRLLLDMVEARTEELQTALTDAEKANKAKSAFLANISHELRTPLNGIVGMTHLLLDMVASAEQKDFLEDTLESANRLQALVDDLLALSSIEAGDISFRPRCLNVRETLDSTIDFYKQRAERKGLEFELSIEDSVPECVVSDLERVRQALMNIMNNAVRFTRTGTVSLNIKAWGQGIGTPDSNTIGLLFSVTNTGEGIDKSKEKELFEPFTIGEDYMTKGNSGAGLGLAISKRLVDLMGGHLWLESGEGGQTTFCFVAPCALCDTLE